MSQHDPLQRRRQLLLAQVECDANAHETYLVARRDARHAELAEVAISDKPIPLSNELKLIAAIVTPAAQSLAEIFAKSGSLVGFDTRAIMAAAVLNLSQGALFLITIVAMSHVRHVGKMPRYYEYYWLTGLSLLLGASVAGVSNLSAWGTVFLVVVASLGSSVIAWLMHRQAISHFISAAYPVRAERAAAADADLLAWKNSGRAADVKDSKQRIDEYFSVRSSTGSVDVKTDSNGEPNSRIQSMGNAGGQNG